MTLVVVALSVLIAVAVCIRIRHTAEAKFRREESRLHQLVDSLPHFIYHLDAADRYVIGNAAVADYFGRSREEVIGRTAVELGVPADLASEWTAQNARVRDLGKTISVDLVARTEAGSIRHIRNTLSPALDDEGRIAGVIGIGIDVTEQRDAEAANRRLLSAVEQMAEIMFTTDVEGRITYVNPAFEKVYGYTREEAIGQTPRIIKSGELPEAHYQWFWSDLLAGRTVTIEYANRAKDGTPVYVIGTAAPVHEEGKIAGFVAVQQDVTARNRAIEERRRLDDRLERLARMEALGTLAGGIAHDFNNILSIILSHVELVERATRGEPRAATAIRTVKQAVRRGAGLSAQILTFARRTEVPLEVVEVAPLLRELGSMLSETLPRTVTVSVDLAPDLPPLRADASQLHQAIVNLCLNARDAMPGGGTVRISASTVAREQVADLIDGAVSSNWVCLAVSDDGTGMDAETRQRIFEPFFTTKEKGHGTGLGLAVVYGIVKAHGGAVDLESEPGRGTTFRVYLPIADAATTATSVAEDAPQRRRGGDETVLLVDDETAILEGLSVELTAVGYRVLTACDGPGALEICRGAGPRPDVVVSDLGMPLMPAPELIRSLREALPDVPVIGMTGYVDPVFHENILGAGVAYILQKPFDAELLLHTVRDVLDRR